VGIRWTDRWCESRNCHLGVLRVFELIFETPKVAVGTWPRLARLVASGGRLGILLLMHSQGLAGVVKAIEPQADAEL